MKIGAILTLAATNGKEADSSESGKDAARKRRRFLSNTPDVKLDVLGKSLVDRTIEKLRAAGVEATTVIPEGPAGTQVLPTHSLLSNDFISACSNF